MQKKVAKNAKKKCKKKVVKNAKKNAKKRCKTKCNKKIFYKKYSGKILEKKCWPKKIEKIKKFGTHHPTKYYWKLFRKNFGKKMLAKKNFKKNNLGTPPLPEVAAEVASEVTLEKKYLEYFILGPPKQISGTPGGKILNYRDLPPQADQWDTWWQNFELQGHPPPVIRQT